MIYSINDVCGYSGLTPSRQKELRIELDIDLEKHKHNGHMQSCYTKEQLEALLIGAGWSKVDKGYTLSKRHITFEEKST